MSDKAKKPLAENTSTPVKEETPEYKTCLRLNGDTGIKLIRIAADIKELSITNKALRHTSINYIIERAVEDIIDSLEGKSKDVAHVMKVLRV
jgi:hypothetical protein